MQFFKLAKVKRVASFITQDNKKTQIELETVKMIVSNRLQIMAEYSRNVILPVLMNEWKKEDNAAYLDAKKFMTRSECLLDAQTKQRALLLLRDHPILNRVYQFKMALQKIWEQTTENQQAQLDALKQWSKEAVNDGNPFLANFAQHLSGYSVSK